MSTPLTVSIQLIERVSGCRYFTVWSIGLGPYTKLSDTKLVIFCDGELISQLKKVVKNIKVSLKVQ